MATPWGDYRQVNDMPVPLSDRPLDTLRDQAVDQLIMNYGHGHLSLEAFQDRLDRAFDATCHGDLLALTNDLDLVVDSSYVAHKRQAFQAAPAPDAPDVDWVINVLGGSERGGDWVVPAQIRVLNILGGGDLDFSRARFTSPTTRVKVLCFCGGMDIYVPEGVQVHTRTVNVLGGVGNNAPHSTDPEAPRLVVEGLVLLGGLDVKVRRTFKERMLEFADGVRALFGGSPQSG